MAHRHGRERRLQARPLVKRHPSTVTFDVVRHFLGWRWSPEQIALTMARVHPQGHPYRVPSERGRRINGQEADDLGLNRNDPAYIDYENPLYAKKLGITIDMTLKFIDSCPANIQPRPRITAPISGPRQ